MRPSADTTLVRARAELDQRQASLRAVLRALGPVTIDRILLEFHQTYEQSDNMEDKLYAHIGIVGVLSTMIGAIDGMANADLPETREPT